MARVVVSVVAADNPAAVRLVFPVAADKLLVAPAVGAGNPVAAGSLPVAQVVAGNPVAVVNLPVGGLVEGAAPVDKS